MKVLLFMIVVFALVFALAFGISSCEKYAVKQHMPAAIVQPDGSIIEHVAVDDLTSWQAEHSKVIIVSQTAISNLSYGKTGEFIIIYKK